jgi:hypothetical protein
LLGERPTAELLVTREGSYVVEAILLEPVELADDELDAVAGGLLNLASGNQTVGANNEEELQIVTGAVTNSFNG